jgi:hypothetical protein
MSPVFGFDLMKFEDFLKVADDESIADTLERDYGVESVQLVKSLISFKSPVFKR